MNHETEAMSYAAYLKDVMERGVLEGQLPVITADPNRLPDQARQLMSKKGFDYINGGAGESATVQANRPAFRQWEIIPRVLRPTSPQDLSVTLFGHRYDTPILMAPVGVQSLYHKDGEIGTANACAALRVPFTLNTVASTSIEHLVKTSAQGPKWFQLYWPSDDNITVSLLRRAEASGYGALVVTLDTWTLAWRPRDINTANMPFLLGQGNYVGFQDAVFKAKIAREHDGSTPESDKTLAAAKWIAECFPGISRGWEQLGFLRDHWHGPIVLKGILSVEDAKLACKHGMDGIVVRNYGGRQLDGAVASLDALPDIVDAVGREMTVLFDSGIRTGADVVKALALGAKAVFVGRPVVYGLGIGSEAGAQAVLAGLLADLDLTMGFAGVKRVAELERSLLRKAIHPGYSWPKL